MRKSHGQGVLPAGLRRTGWLLAALVLALGLGCAPNYLEPGPNPAKVRVQVEARSQVEARTARHYDATPTWYWGLYGAGPSRKGAPFPPAEGRLQPYQTAKVLSQEATFLLPPGRQRVVLRLEADLDVPDSEGSKIVTVATYEEVLTLDLKPGVTTTIKRRFGF